MLANPSGGLRRALRQSTALIGPSLAVLCLAPLAAPPAAAQSAADVNLPTLVVRAPQSTTDAAAADADFTPVPDAAISGSIAAAATLATSDSGSLLSRIPGGAAWGAGGVSSLPAINGMGADRVQIGIDGMLFGMACPNLMNPPLSFVNWV